METSYLNGPELTNKRAKETEWEILKNSGEGRCSKFEEIGKAADFFDRIENHLKPFGGSLNSTPREDHRGHKTDNSCHILKERKTGGS